MGSPFFTDGTFRNQMTIIHKTKKQNSNNVTGIKDLRLSRD